VYVKYPLYIIFIILLLSQCKSSCWCG